MFGFSLGKFILVLVVAVLGWLAFRRFGARSARPVASAPPSEPLTVEDLVKCRVCGVYVQTKGAAACERSSCPQRCPPQH